MMTIDELIAVTFRQMLEAMKGQLGKAANHAREAGLNEDELLAARLAPDMFPLAAQIRFSCGLARECFARLAGQPIAEVRQIAGLGDAIGLIDETLAVLDYRDPGAADASTRQVEIALPTGMTFDLRGDEYVRDWALPQFYFHVLTAYAILRSRGVPLGKADYVPHMMRYLRS